MIEQAGRRAVARAIDRLEAATSELPGDVALGRGDDRVILRGNRVALRRLTDARLRGLALAARGGRA